jgi:hypothetical protein
LNTFQTAFPDEEVVVPLSPVPELALPWKRRYDIIPDDMAFREIDEHAIKVRIFVIQTFEKPLFKTNFEYRLFALLR